jgi:hypothetical protein
MNKILAKMGLMYLASKLDGKKTYVGAAVLMLLGTGKIIAGLVGVIGNMYPDVGAPEIDLDGCYNMIQAGVAAFGAGLAAIGIGHKVEKTK